MELLKIIGIFDRQDIVLDFRRSPFFIVGPNGTGKSTSLKIMHYVLTRQWSRLSDIPFQGIEFSFVDGTSYLEREDFVRFDRYRSYLFRFGRRVSTRPQNILVPSTWSVAKEYLTREIQGIRGTINKPPVQVVAQLEANYEAIAKIYNFVERESRGRVLYFPTYRRIERDLRELLESDEEQDELFSSDENLAPKIANRFSQAGEVIGFGGQDIRQLLSAIASSIEVEARRTLSEHSVRFLEALTKDETSATKTSRASNLTEGKINKLLDRISSSAFAKLDIEAVKQSIKVLRSKVTKGTRGRPTQRQEMLLYYVTELIKANDKIDQLATPLAQFSSVITKYLAPVKKSYLRESDNKVVVLDSSDNEIELDQLSSGEKQILAFFAFITLEGGLKPKFIIIDEPELSLSVSWQKSLIEDIMNLNPEAVLISATHSPFIFENFPIDNVISLGDL